MRTGDPGDSCVLNTVSQPCPSVKSKSKSLLMGSLGDIQPTSSKTPVTRPGLGLRNARIYSTVILGKAHLGSDLGCVCLHGEREQRERERESKVGKRRGTAEKCFLELFTLLVVLPLGFQAPSDSQGQEFC